MIVTSLDSRLSSMIVSDKTGEGSRFMITCNQPTGFDAADSTAREQDYDYLYPTNNFDIVDSNRTFRLLG